jgi:hypothetical protein
LILWKGYPLDEAIWKQFDSLYSSAEEVLRTFYKNSQTVKTHKNREKTKK